MKSYTNIEQSKKLAEILPVESADMWWSKNFLYYNPTACVGISSDYTDVYTYKWGDDDIPCWSVAALLGVLPLEVETHKQTDGHKTYHYVESYMKRMDKEIYLSTELHENLVDACYEMILKLKEKNLLQC